MWMGYFPIPWMDRLINKTVKWFTPDHRAILWLNIFVPLELFPLYLFSACSPGWWVLASHQIPAHLEAASKTENWCSPNLQQTCLPPWSAFPLPPFSRSSQPPSAGSSELPGSCHEGGAIETTLAATWDQEKDGEWVALKWPLWCPLMATGALNGPSGTHAIPQTRAHLLSPSGPQKKGKTLAVGRIGKTGGHAASLSCSTSLRESLQCIQRRHGPSGVHRSGFETGSDPSKWLFYLFSFGCLL